MTVTFYSIFFNFRSLGLNSRNCC